MGCNSQPTRLGCVASCNGLGRSPGRIRSRARRAAPRCPASTTCERWPAATPRRPRSRSLMGFRIDEIEEGRVTFAAEPAEYHYNPIGIVHGGLAATLLDSVMGCAVHSTLPAGRLYSTLEVKVNFVRPITVGHRHRSSPRAPSCTAAAGWPPPRDACTPRDARQAARARHHHLLRSKRSPNRPGGLHSHADDRTHARRGRADRRRQGRPGGGPHRRAAARRGCARQRDRRARSRGPTWTSAPPARSTWAAARPTPRATASS